MTTSARGARCAAGADRLAEATGAAPAAVRERLLHAMAAMATLAPRPPSELDWHRILDTAVLDGRA